MSCLWQNDYLLSVSLSGFINYLDVNNPKKPLRIIKVLIVNSKVAKRMNKHLKEQKTKIVNELQFFRAITNQ